MIIHLNRFYAFLFSLALVIITFSFAFAAQKEDIAEKPSGEISVPIIMYHHVTKKNSRANRYTVLYSELENDLKYIKSKGYETITVKDLIDYVDGEKELSDKVILITFDDGFESFYSLVYPLLKEYNMKAVVSVIGYVSDKYSKIDDHNINYSNLNWKEIKELSDSGYVEIQNHTYDMHGIGTKGRRGVAKMKNESEKKYEKSLTEDLSKMQKLIKENIGFEATAIAYPYGAYTSTTHNIIKFLGFKCSFTCEEKISTVIKGQQDSLYFLGRYNRPTGTDSEKFFSKLLIQ